MGVATLIPMPAISLMRVQRACAAEMRSNSSPRPLDLMLDHLPLAPERVDQVTHQRAQVGLSGSKMSAVAILSLLASAKHRSPFQQEGGTFVR
jgi:hypothetical protein